MILRLIRAWFLQPACLNLYADCARKPPAICDRCRARWDCNEHHAAIRPRLR
jgi:hypothetical protein